MPTFDTPEPIFATIDLVAGGLRIRAGDLGDTVVEVRPSDESDEADVQAAKQLRVEYAGGKLEVQAVRTRSRWWPFGWSGSVQVTIDLPAGSRVDAKVASAEVRCEGRLGECTVNAASGEVRLDQTGTLWVSATHGAVSVARSVGSTYVATTHGEVWIREVDGTALVKTTSGAITLGEVTGDLRLSTAYGNITVDRALASVSAKSAYGSVRVREVVRGSVALETSYGELEVGVRQGTAAWLDVSTRYGRLRSSLDPAGDPGPSEQTVGVRARSSYGDIVIRRS